MSRFQGFDLSQREYKTRRFTCRGCPNVCQISEVRFSEVDRFYYGARCDRYDEQARSRSREIPDLFARRESMLLAEDGVPEGDEGMLRYSARGSHKGTVGVPRALLAWEKLPFFREYLRELGYDVLLSPHTHRNLLRASVAEASPTACLPVKVVHGHVEALLATDIDYLFLPAM
ncbi:MAG: acyl-CoA dehydratase activase-related protein, partial [Candidatus Bipolaricaulota bacterium]